MKKTIFITAVLLGVVILSLSTVSPVLAQGGSGNGNAAGNVDSTGNGQHGDLGTGTGIPMEQNINLDGILADLIHENLATALGIAPEDLSARLDDGETISSIALSLGFDSSAISDILVTARADALAQAVLDGTLTQEQADWLASRGTDAPALGIGDGTCDGDCTPDGTNQKTMTKFNQRKSFGK
ncbi:MAG: hypothetical protein ABFS03_01365 [Chloroflexota bacterium]